MFGSELPNRDKILHNRHSGKNGEEGGPIGQETRHEVLV